MRYIQLSPSILSWKAGRTLESVTLTATGRDAEWSFNGTTQRIDTDRALTAIDGIPLFSSPQAGRSILFGHDHCQH